MFKRIAAPVLILGFVALAAARDAFKCPSIDIKVDLDLERYSGVWYQMAKIKGAPFETGVCAQAR